MQQQNIPIATLVDIYKRGELRLPEIQRHYVWQGTIDPARFIRESVRAEPVEAL